MRGQPSAAWLELGYAGPSTEDLNAELAAAVQKEREQHQVKKAERAAIPPRRVEMRKLWAGVHDSLKDVTSIGKVWHE